MKNLVRYVSVENCSRTNPERTKPWVLVSLRASGNVDPAMRGWRLVRQQAGVAVGEFDLVSLEKKGGTNTVTACFSTSTTGRFADTRDVGERFSDQRKA